MTKFNVKTQMKKTKKRGGEEELQATRMGIVISPVAACAFVACIIAMALAGSLLDGGLSRPPLPNGADGVARVVGSRGSGCVTGCLKGSLDSTDFCQDSLSTLGLHASGAASTCTGTTSDDLLVSDRNPEAHARIAHARSGAGLPLRCALCARPSRIGTASPY